MKSEKLKKLLKKIKKLKKLKKSKKIKKTENQNLYLSADIESLKQKIKQQEILLSQMKYPYQAPVSTVSYEKMGIGQQNALNQANLENIQKNIEDKLEDQFEDQSQKIETAIKAIKQREFRAQRENESDKDYAKYVKKSKSNKIAYAKNKQNSGNALSNAQLRKINQQEEKDKKAKLKKEKEEEEAKAQLKKIHKSIDETEESSGIKNIINATGTLKKTIYSDTDNQGEFSINSFNSSKIQQNSNETFDNDVDQINNDINADINKIDNQKGFVNTTTDQNVQVENSGTELIPRRENETDKDYDKRVKKSISNKNNYAKNKKENKPLDKDVEQVIKSTKSSSNPIIQPSDLTRDNDGNPLSKQQLRQLNKKNKSTVNKTKNSPIVDISGMNNKIENTEVQISRESENLNNQAANLGLFIPT